MSNLPDNPQPVSPEVQARQFSEELIFRLAEFKDTYNSEKKKQIQGQLQELSQKITTVGTDHVIKELDRQKRSEYEKITAISSSEHKIMRTNIINIVSNEYINKKNEKIDEQIVDFRVNENDRNLNLLRRLESISEAKGFLINLATSRPPEK